MVPGQRGYKTEKAYTVAQAREFLRHASSNLIILDVLGVRVDALLTSAMGLNSKGCDTSQHTYPTD